MQAKLEEANRRWAVYYGYTNCEVVVRLVPQEELGTGDIRVLANVECDVPAQVHIIRISNEVTQRQAIRLLRHEWLHIVLSDVREAHFQASSHLPAAAQKIANEQVDSFLEKAVRSLDHAYERLGVVFPPKLLKD